MYVNKYIKILLFKIFLINNSTIIGQHYLVPGFQIGIWSPASNLHQGERALEPSTWSRSRPLPPTPSRKGSSVRAPSGHDSLRQFVDSACPVSPVTHELFFSCEPGFPNVLSPRLFCTHAWFPENLENYRVLHSRTRHSQVNLCKLFITCVLVLSSTN